MKSLFLSAALSALAIGATAQTTIAIAPEAGVNLSTLRTSINGSKTTSSTNAGVRGGFNVNIGLGEQLAIQPGLFYSQKGGKFEYSTAAGTATYNATQEYSINYVEIPVNLVYHFNNNQSGFFLMAGAYAAAAVGGKAKFTSNAPGITGINRSIEIGGDEMKDDIRRWDAGAQGGAGYQTAMGLFVRAQYILGAMNINSHNNSADAMRNGAVGITIGYRL
jgi:hypothetical protein